MIDHLAGAGGWRNLFGSRRTILLAIASLGMLAAAGACGTADSGSTGGGGDASGQVTAELLLADGKLTLLAIRSADANIPPTPEPAEDQASLAWEFTGEDGASLASGHITEPRQAESDFNETGTADPWVGTAPAVIVRLLIPSAGGTLRLLKTSTASQPLQPQGVGDGEEIDSVPIPAPGGSGGEATGCNGGTDPQTNGPGVEDVAGVDGLVKIVDNGSCPGNVNILILSEGYTQAEMGQFITAAKGMASSMLNITGFKEYKDRFNVWALQVPSTDSGITDPQNNVKKNTAFNTAFGNDNPTPRRCVIPQSGVSSQVQKLRTAAEKASKANITAMLINITEHAGCAIPSERLVTVASNNLAPSVFAHELGHSLYNLRDEYTEGTCNMTRAGGGPNTTKNASNPPWKSVVNSVVEGAEYCETGVYRAEQNCLMRSLNAPFCKVCANEAGKFFAGRESCEAAPPPSCFQGGVECTGGTVCSWNGKDDGYCCKQPFKGTETCTTDAECGSGKICGFGGPPDNFFWCVEKDSPPCVK